MGNTDSTSFKKKMVELEFAVILVTLNPALVVDEHPLPTIEELFASMSGGTIFAKIDLQQAYLQLAVAEEDKELLTLST